MLSDDHTDSAFGVDDSGNSVRVQDDIPLGHFKGHEICDRGQALQTDHPYELRDRQDSDYELQPHILVRALAKWQNFSTSLENLMKCLNVTSADVKKTAVKYPSIFHMKESEIELKPKLRICQAHCGPLGCQNFDSCFDLHICNRFILESCDTPECYFGHNWNTGHNHHILKSLFLDALPSEMLCQLVKGHGTEAVQGSRPDICHSYNGEGCYSEHCESLHICHAFVVGVAKGNFSSYHDDCHRSHSFQSFNCLSVLEKYGLPTNESPRDIVLSIVSANPSLCSEGSRIVCQKENSNVSQGRELDTPHLHQPHRKSNLLESDANGKEMTPSKTLSFTVFSNDIIGNVPIPEICYYSVESLCNHENSGCERLHSSLHFHWQVSENGEKWLNLRRAQVTCLERAFCDPNKDSVIIPKLDPASPKLRDLLTLMGVDTWWSDFHCMTLLNSTATQKLFLRRLCTEKIDGVKIDASVYVWYFLGDNKSWIQFSLENKNESNNHICAVTPEHLEAEFLQDPHSVKTLTFFNINYVVNFQEMLLINGSTGEHWKIMRRPDSHFHDKWEHIEELTDTWEGEVVLPNERVKRTSLRSESSEFKFVFNLLNQYETFDHKVLNIEKIQNPYLCRAFRNKKKEMVAIYKSLGAVDVQYLFHGTKSEKVTSICEDNFDWRFNGLEVEQDFGHGTYFRTNAVSSCVCAEPDSKGHRYLFVARVAVGSKKLGNSSMKRPPMNHSILSPYHSTVNNEQTPTIIVKYDKQEYYPEYLVTFC